jgi:hypothetical protein
VRVRQSVAVSFFIGKVYQRNCEMEEGVEFYSTPFVFITDTFTGEVLYGKDIGGGHFFVLLVIG